MDKLSHAAASVPDIGPNLYRMMEGLYDRLSCQLLSTGGLAIKASGGILVKAATLCKAIVNGRLVSIAANTDCAALSGTVAAGKINVFCFFVDKAGTLTTAMGVEGATLGAVKFPPLPKKKAMVGFIILTAGTSDFVGNNATAGVLDATTYAASVIYVNTVGAFDPTAAI